MPKKRYNGYVILPNKTRDGRVRRRKPLPPPANKVVTEERALSGYLKLRLQIVAKLLVSRQNEHEVTVLIRDRWGLSRRRAVQYVGMVYGIWADSYKADIARHGAKAIGDREQVVRLAMEQGRLQTALKAMDSRDRILGLLQNTMRVEGEISHKHEHSLSTMIEKAKNGGFGRGTRFSGLTIEKGKN